MNDHALIRRLLALATHAGGNEEEKRTAAMKAARLIVEAHLLTPKHADRDLARQGWQAPRRGGASIQILWTRAQAAVIGRSRNESTGTKDPALALVRFIYRRRELFGDP